MSKAALALVGIAAAVGIGLAIKHADAAEETPGDPNDNIDTGDDVVTEEPDSPPQPSGNGNQGADPPPAPPAAGDPGGTGSGNSSTGDGTFQHSDNPILNPLDQDFIGNLILTASTVLPPPFDEMSLFPGVKSLQFAGIDGYGPEGIMFGRWLQPQNIAAADMPLYIFVSVENPRDWISAFLHTDPPGSNPPSHYIEYEVSNDTKNAAWMRHNLLNK